MLGPLVDLRRRQGIQHRDDPMGGVVGKLGSALRTTGAVVALVGTAVHVSNQVRFSPKRAEGKGGRRKAPTRSVVFILTKNRVFFLPSFHPTPLYFFT